MRMLDEFRDFAVKGNVIDLAVGIIIGAAFTKIVNSLVADVLMPPLGLLLGNADFSEFVVTLREKTADADAVVLRYGQFANAVIDFLIVAFAVFLIVKQVNRMKRAETPTPPTTKHCPHCISAIDVKATRCPHCTSEVAGTA